MLFAQTPHPRLLLAFEQEHFMNHRHLISKLNVHQRLGHRFAYMSRMRGFAAKNNAEADDGGVFGAARKARRYHRYFERALSDAALA